MCGDSESQLNSGKSRAEICIELAKLAQESFAGRRAVEWKLAFGLWTGIGVVTYFAVENGTRFEGNWWLRLLGISYLAIGLVWTFLYQPLIRRANDVDKSFKKYYVEIAEGRESKRPEVHSRWTNCKEYKSSLLQWWTLAHVVPTVAFLIVSFALILCSTMADSDVQVDTHDKASVTISGRNLEKAVNAVDKVVNHFTEGGAALAVPSNGPSPPSVHDSGPRPTAHGQRTNGTPSP